MAYTIDALARHGVNLPQEKRRQSVVVHVWNKIAAPMARRKISDSETTYQPTRKVGFNEKTLRNTSMEASKQLPMSADEAEAAHKAEMQRNNSAKLREQRDAAMARSQAIADGMKDAVRKIWPNAWGRK